MLWITITDFYANRFKKFIDRLNSELITNRHSIVNWMEPGIMQDFITLN